MLELLAQIEWYWIAILAIGFGTGVLSGMGSSGSLLEMPLLIVMGVPPTVVIGSGKISALVALPVAVVKFHLANRVRWDIVPILAVLAIIGGIVGANITVSIDTDALVPVLGAVLLIVVPVVLYSRHWVKRFANPKRHHVIAGYFGYALVMIYGGFFGVGQGPFVFLALSVLGLSPLHIQGTARAPQTILAVASGAVFLYHGYVDWWLVLALVASKPFGVWVGAHIALKKGNDFVRIMVASVALLSGIKLLFFSNS
ncbi:MAG: sulfite exporter TauE/SafE family protein [Gammaproteobacteria bacterium]|nr:sulfite exporter TauE/SafE family protein [Gammaproteobacteria bacterium]